MTDREEAGLRRLKRDLEHADWPSPELLARYATEPNRLREDEKEAVERALASSPIVADELATLRGFDFSRLDADRRGTSAAAEASAASAGGPVLRWIRLGWLARPPVWAATAALLALTYWLAQSAPTNGSPDASEASPQLAEHAPTPAPSTSDRTGAPEVAEHGDEEPSPEPGKVQIAASGNAAKRTDEFEIESTPQPAEHPPAPAPAREAEPRKGEVRLAMAMPDYRPAYGVETESGSEWIVRGGEIADVKIAVLAPDHLARACSASPTLHWSIDPLPEKGELFLTIVDADDEPIILDQPIPRPSRVGLQRLDLSASSISLPAGRKLRWSVALRNEEASAPITFDFGWVRVEPLDAATAAALAIRDDAIRAAGYAELGCYSEALEAALVARATHPGEPEMQRAVTKLAEQAGFDARLAGN